MRDKERVEIKTEEIENIEQKGEQSIIKLKESKGDVEWGNIYEIEIVHGAFRERLYGYFGYKRDRIVEV